MAIFMDIELVSIDEAVTSDWFEVAFDVIYAGETWCRSLVCVDMALASRLEKDDLAVIGAAREALLDVLASEVEPVSLHLRLGRDGTTILARATPYR